MMRRHLPRNFVDRILFRPWKTLRNDPILRFRSELEAMEEWTEDARRAHRAGLLARLLTAAGDAVPAWQDRIPRDRQITAENSPEVLAALPTTDKSTYQEWKERAYDQLHGSRWIASSTGGSTGEPFHFRCDLSASPWRRANTARCLAWLGIETADPTAVLWGFALGASRWHDMRSGLRNFLSNQLTLSSFAMDADELDRHLRRLVSFQPRMIVGYPSALAVLAERARHNAVPIRGLRAVLSSGETLFETQRELIEEGFRAPLYNRYGSREFANVAHECKERSGLHVLDDLMWVELLDENGMPTPPGAVGELVVTDLHNHAMPFIRYRTGDLAEWSDERCGCGRPQPLLRRIVGRAFDVVLTPGGARVGGYFWTWLSRAVPGIKAFQVFQDSVSGVELRIVPGADWREEAVAVLESHVANSCGEDFHVAVEIVDEIPLTPSGKHRFILSRIGSAS